jgi:hypothetical protein
MITVAMVRTGDKYGVEYVQRLVRMVDRHMTAPHRFICITDQPEKVKGVDMIRTDLPGWWAKMALFSPDIRGAGRCVYFDLDTVIIDDLSALVALDADFATCANFTKAVEPAYPCNYGSCIMVMRDGFGGDIFKAFMAESAQIMADCKYGDQQAIERLYPNAVLLQYVLPDGYLVGRRDFTDTRPEGAAIMIFAGNHKPHNTPHRWLKEAWHD